MKSTSQLRRANLALPIWNDHQSEIRAYIENRTPHIEDTDDILQNTYLNIYLDPLETNNPESIRIALRRRAQKEIIRHYGGDELNRIIDNSIKQASFTTFLLPLNQTPQ